MVESTSEAVTAELTTYEFDQLEERNIWRDTSPDATQYASHGRPWHRYASHHRGHHWSLHIAVRLR